MQHFSEVSPVLGVILVAFFGVFSVPAEGGDGTLAQRLSRDSSGTVEERLLRNFSSVERALMGVKKEEIAGEFGVAKSDIQLHGPAGKESESCVSIDPVDARTPEPRPYWSVCTFANDQNRVFDVELDLVWPLNLGIHEVGKEADGFHSRLLDALFSSETVAGELMPYDKIAIIILSLSRNRDSAVASKTALIFSAHLNVSKQLNERLPDGRPATSGSSLLYTTGYLPAAGEVGRGRYFLLFGDRDPLKDAKGFQFLQEIGDAR